MIAMQISVKARSISILHQGYYFNMPNRLPKIIEKKKLLYLPRYLKVFKKIVHDLFNSKINNEVL